MDKVKVVSDKSSWFGQVGEYVRHEAAEAEEGAEAVVTVVLRMAGSRLVEFQAHELEPVADEPKPDAAE